MANKPTVEVQADFGDAQFALGLVSGLTKQVRTDRYLGDVITYVHANLSREFDLHMDNAVQAAPFALGHVYEWRSINASKAPGDRLWEHQLLGRGGQRSATWTWRASQTPIPTPQERKKIKGDPMQQVPQNIIDEKLSERKYIFYWKAPIMEYAMPVRIYPKYAQALFIPTGDASRPFVLRTSSGPQPGMKGNVGQFTLQWTNWWNNSANAYFNSYLKSGLEKDMAETVQRGVRTRTKKVGLSFTSSPQAAFESGEKWAEDYVKQYERKYRRGSR